MPTQQGGITFDDVVSNPKYQAAPNEIKAQEALNYFSSRIATNPKYQAAPPEVQMQEWNAFKTHYNVPEIKTNTQAGNQTGPVQTNFISDFTNNAINAAAGFTQDDRLKQSGQGVGALLGTFAGSLPAATAGAVAGAPFGLLGIAGGGAISGASLATLQEVQRQRMANDPNVGRLGATALGGGLLGAIQLKGATGLSTAAKNAAVQGIGETGFSALEDVAGGSPINWQNALQRGAIGAAGGAASAIGHQRPRDINAQAPKLDADPSLADFEAKYAQQLLDDYLAGHEARFQQTITKQGLDPNKVASSKATALNNQYSELVPLLNDPNTPPAVRARAAALVDNIQQAYKAVAPQKVQKATITKRENIDRLAKATVKLRAEGQTKQVNNRLNKYDPKTKAAIYDEVNRRETAQRRAAKNEEALAKMKAAQAERNAKALEKAEAAKRKKEQASLKADIKARVGERVTIEKQKVQQATTSAKALKKAEALKRKQEQNRLKGDIKARMGKRVQGEKELQKMLQGVVKETAPPKAKKTELAPTKKRPDIYEQMAKDAAARKKKAETPKEAKPKPQKNKTKKPIARTERQAQIDEVTAVLSDMREANVENVIATEVFDKLGFKKTKVTTMKQTGIFYDYDIPMNGKVRIKQGDPITNYRNYAKKPLSPQGEAIIKRRIYDTGEIDTLKQGIKDARVNDGVEVSQGERYEAAQAKANIEIQKSDAELNDAYTRAEQSHKGYLKKLDEAQTTKELDDIFSEYDNMEGINLIPEKEVNEFANKYIQRTEALAKMDKRGADKAGDGVPRSQDQNAQSTRKAQSKAGERVTDRQQIRNEIDRAIESGKLVEIEYYAEGGHSQAAEYQKHNLAPARMEATRARIAELEGKIQAAEQAGRGTKTLKTQLQQAKNSLNNREAMVKRGVQKIGGEDLDKAHIKRKELVYERFTSEKTGADYVRTVDENGAPTTRLIDGEGQQSRIEAIRVTDEPSPFRVVQEENPATGKTKAVLQDAKTGKAIEWGKKKTDTEHTSVVASNLEDIIKRAKEGKATSREIMDVTKGLNEQQLKTELGKLDESTRNKIIKEAGCD